ncbi:MAG TPA: dTDP-4-dehydrorhamnose 3,5-epimerase family protein [Thermoleophilaceae bacterium]|nr:dTDP-4-dehydrorhamnose 3,5-epimerase family protein [Thermoleophilaceae bacterium]
MASRPPIDIDVPAPGSPEPQTVTPEGERLDEFIDGVSLRPAITHSDERGSLTEIYDPAWGFTDEPLVYVYESRIHPGQKKAWIVHFEQDDRLFFSVGSAKVVLYDARTDSPTQGQVQELFLGTVNRGLLRIPAGVVHGIVNIGPDEVRFVNMPTRAYRHEQPDKLRFAADTDAIPYEL